MTQKQKYTLLAYRNKALRTYLDFCIKFNEVPREDLVILIDSCGSVEALKEVINKTKTKLL